MDDQPSVKIVRAIAGSLVGIATAATPAIALYISLTKGVLLNYQNIWLIIGVCLFGFIAATFISSGRS